MIIKVYLRNLLLDLARWEGSPIAQSLLPLEGSSLAASWLILRQWMEPLGLPPGCCGDTESALLAAVANGLEGTDGLVSTTIAFLAAVAIELGGTGAEVSPTINTGVLGVGVAVLVTVTGRFVLRKSRSMHF